MDPKKAYNILCIKGDGKVKLCSKGLLDIVNDIVYENCEIYEKNNKILLLQENNLSCILQKDVFHIYLGTPWHKNP